jgi:hypothetical protein
MTAPADSVDIAVAGDPARARDTIAGALAARGFAVTWSDDWNGLATRGSKTKQLVLGTFALYLEVSVTVFSVDNAVIVRLSRPSTGMTGGLAGRAKARKQFASLTAEVTEVLRANGVLIPPPATS